MKILMATSEAVPYVKTGGLADMISALSLALAKQGHELRMVLPRYYAINRAELGLEPLEGPMGVPMGGREEWSGVYAGILPGSPQDNPVRTYFIDHENFFGRDGIYGVPSEP
ncbi:MAG: glycogen/starch synthase, partial [Treponema sp.]|nr:glycogen/starch synthase [Treponema sp.]